MQMQEHPTPPSGVPPTTNRSADQPWLSNTNFAAGQTNCFRPRGKRCGGILLGDFRENELRCADGLSMNRAGKDFPLEKWYSARVN